MNTKSILPLAVLLLVSCTPAHSQRPSTGAIQELLLNVQDAYSGERARDVVGFVEQYWRVPGNTGFDASIRRVVDDLEDAGYTAEEIAYPGARLTYRVERRPMARPTWEPIDASLTIVGRDEPLLALATNRSMITAYSYSTPPSGVEAEVVDVGAGRPEDFEGVDVSGKIVFGEANTGRLFREAVQRRGAAGVLSYGLPAYNRPERYQNSISFGSIPLDSIAQSFGLRLSYAARETLKSALAAGPVRMHVMTESRIYPSEELTLVAEVRGDTHADERFVFSAHVQEPGANDNASGVGALSEIARVFGEEHRAGRFDPARTITMIWGDEISSTRRYLEEDSTRTAGVLWGLSLDMVGEDTEKTGGTFLIEKMPDPSSVWTRGDDQHTNPYEGGSDHVPFLRAGKPGLLLWHFTDVFYHTDRDRLEMVSAETLKNAGVCAAVTAMTLTAADGETARFVIEELERSAVDRLDAEAALSRAAVASGEAVEEQRTILRTWTEWYEAAIRTAEDIELGGASVETLEALEQAVARVRERGDSLGVLLEGPG
jgi:hypothetical protein